MAFKYSSRRYRNANHELIYQYRRVSIVLLIRKALRGVRLKFGEKIESSSHIAKKELHHLFKILVITNGIVKQSCSGKYQNWFMLCSKVRNYHLEQT